MQISSVRETIFGNEQLPPEFCFNLLGPPMHPNLATKALLMSVDIVRPIAPEYLGLHTSFHDLRFGAVCWDLLGLKPQMKD